MNDQSHTSLSSLKDKQILLGVSAGIAAYKAAYLARELVKAGAYVQVVMTPAATEFVGPMTFAGLTGRATRLALNDQEAEIGMGHIELARWADLILIAPATANTIAKLAHGMADNLLTTICLAYKGPLIIAPAMNQQMWLNEATQSNIRTLESRHIKLIGPDTGDQACGDEGYGRMSEPESILAQLSQFTDDLNILEQDRSIQSSYSVLITAGPTHEAIDPVRYLGNQSSGRMGYAIAARMAQLGAKVTLISGPTCLATPSGVRRIDVVSAQDMHQRVMAEAATHDIFISVAAVADYRPASAHHEKMKKDQAEQITLSLIANPDILRDVATLEERPYCVGFAAETQDIATYARKKLQDKNLDLICANHVGSDTQGFGDNPNALTLYWADGELTLPRQDKSKLAEALCTIIIERYETSIEHLTD